MTTYQITISTGDGEDVVVETTKWRLELLDTGEILESVPQKELINELPV